MKLTASRIAIAAFVAFATLATGSIEIRLHSTVAKANDSGENNMGGSGVPGQDGYNPTFHKDELAYGRTRSRDQYNNPYGAQGEARVIYRKPVAIAYKPIRTVIHVAAAVPLPTRRPVVKDDRQAPPPKDFAPKFATLWSWVR